MENPNRCEQCQAFDLETKNLMNELFHQDEISIMILLLCQSMYDARLKLNKFHNTKAQEHFKAQTLLRKHIDYVSTTLGKFTVSIDDLHKKPLYASLDKLGIVLQFNHEKCPHQQEPVAP